ncbi:MAG: type II secretion system protein GspG [Acidobacteria bacterium]|nr:type II secretion system protein GspG [Acidobacteriota bacterium]
MPERSERKCEHCGAPIPPRRRNCLVCFAPVHAAPRRGQMAEIAREIPTTHRPDITLHDVPEYREARLRRDRRIKQIVIASIIGCVIVTIAVVLYARAQKQQQAQAATKRRELTARRELDLYAQGLELFYADAHRYPSTQEGLSSLVRRPSTLAVWRGPYVDGDFSVDPWGRDYVYFDINEGKDYVLYTYGPEGESAEKPFLQVHSKGYSGTRHE